MPIAQIIKKLPKRYKTIRLALTIILLEMAFLPVFGQNKGVFIPKLNSELIDTTLIDSKGLPIEKVIVSGGRPDNPIIKKSTTILPSSAVVLADVPAFSWSFGCSPTAGAMLAGYYDRTGYPNMYSGPTNGGVCPLDNSSWGITPNGYGICPLSATMLGLDGRTERGHIDDYWIEYGNDDPDPYIANGWEQHEYADCTADFMKTSQSTFDNSDGTTSFWQYNGAEKWSIEYEDDGGYGMKLFFESREYMVDNWFTQKILGYDGLETGFTYDDYKNEIDEGRPVMIHLTGHTVLGTGYDLDSETVYFHNTWDHNVHNMPWGGIYDGMQMYCVTIFELEPNSITESNQQMDLISGWNIMSPNVMPENKDFMDILLPLIEQDVLTKVMDEEGNVIEERENGWVNNINDIESTEGYKIKVSSNSTLELTGVSTQLPFDIPLTSGWNIISWPSSAEQNGLAAMDDLRNGGQLIKVMNEKGDAIEERDGVWINGIINLMPGEGYKIKVSSDCILTVNDNVLKSDKIKSETIASTHFKPAYIGNGTNHMNIYLINVSNSGIIEGDEIGIFDGEVCVGSTNISAQNSFISIPVSAADGIKPKNGYSNGNPIKIKLYREGIEYPVLIDSLNNSTPVFKMGSSLFAQVEVFTTTGKEDLISGKLTKVKCYPNPFSEEINIEINLQKDSQVEVVVLTQMGQQVKLITSKGSLNNGLHKFAWDGKNFGNQNVSPGIYHIRIVVEDTILHKKVVLSK